MFLGLVLLILLALFLFFWVSWETTRFLMYSSLGLFVMAKRLSREGVAPWRETKLVKRLSSLRLLSIEVSGILVRKENYCVVKPSRFRSNYC